MLHLACHTWVSEDAGALELGTKERLRLSERMTHLHIEESTYNIQLFRKRLSEKVHATISKGFVGGFEITVLHRNFERIAREAMDYVSECQIEAAKVGSTATVSETVY